MSKEGKKERGQSQLTPKICKLNANSSVRSTDFKLGVCALTDNLDMGPKNTRKGDVTSVT